MHEHFDGQKAFEHIETLSGMRRLPGTPGETRARDYVLQAGREAGMDMYSEDFSYSNVPLKVVLPLLCFLLGAVSLAGSLTYLWGTPLTALPGAVLLALIYLGLKWSSGFERFAAKGGKDISANLVGEIKSADPRGVILLCAHYDSKSQVMPVVVRAAFFILGFLTAVLLGIALLVLGIMAAFGLDVLGSPAVFYVSLVPAFFLFALVGNITGNRSPGALDNASGEAVILEMGRVIAGQPLDHFDVRVLSFGCEEVGLCGSINYLIAHGEELRPRPCYMLNFDMPFSPAGTVALNTGFEIPARYTSAKLNDLARAAGSDMGFELKGLFLPVGAAADHMPWCKHGFEVAGFVSATTYVHRSADSVDKINREGLRRTGEVALSVVRALDQELSGGAG